MHKRPDSSDSPGSAGSAGSVVTEIANYDSPGSIGVGNTSVHFQSPRSVTISPNIPCSDCSEHGSKKCIGCCSTVRAFYLDIKQPCEISSVKIPNFVAVVA